MPDPDLVPLGFSLHLYGAILMTFCISPWRVALDGEEVQLRDADPKTVFLVEGIRTFEPMENIEIVSLEISGRPPILPGPCPASAFEAAPNSQSTTPMGGRCPPHVRLRMGEISKDRPLIVVVRNTGSSVVRPELRGYLVGRYFNANEPVADPYRKAAPE